VKAVFTFLVLAPLAFPVVAASAAADSSAQDTAKQFYSACLKLKPSGLPTREQMKTLAPLLSAELVKLIASARRKQEESIRKNPDDKPPWIEGNLFASNYQGVTSFGLGAPTIYAGKASFPVYLEYRDGKHVARWIDVIVLEHANGRWRVWDIYMNAPWSFRSGPNLRSILSGE